MNIKDTLSAIAVALTFYAFVPYIRAILAGTTTPHVFSWVIWSLTTLVVFFAQMAAHAGVGAWPTGVSGAITLGIALVAYRQRGDFTITRSDWCFFVAALVSLPLWYVTADPLWAVVLLTTVDILGFGPTLRKAYHAPYSESLAFYALFVLRSAFAVAALEHYSITTVLFPAAIALACVLLIALLHYRRRVLKPL